MTDWKEGGKTVQIPKHTVHTNVKSFLYKSTKSSRSMMLTEKKRKEKRNKTSKVKIMCGNWFHNKTTNKFNFNPPLFLPTCFQETHLPFSVQKQCILKNPAETNDSVTHSQQKHIYHSLRIHQPPTHPKLIVEDNTYGTLIRRTDLGSLGCRHSEGDHPHKIHHHTQSLLEGSQVVLHNTLQTILVAAGLKQQH